MSRCSKTHAHNLTKETLQLSAYTQTFAALSHHLYFLCYFLQERLTKLLKLKLADETAMKTNAQAAPTLVVPRPDPKFSFLFCQVSCSAPTKAPICAETASES